MPLGCLTLSAFGFHQAHELRRSFPPLSLRQWRGLRRGVESIRTFVPKNLTLTSPWKGEAAHCDLAPHEGVPKLGSLGNIQWKNPSQLLSNSLSTQYDRPPQMMHRSIICNFTAFFPMTSTRRWSKLCR